jgi:nickel/cobalt transporter (NicO) family protein
MRQALRRAAWTSGRTVLLVALLLLAVSAQSRIRAQAQAPVSAFGSKAPTVGTSPFAPPTAAPIHAPGPLGALFSWVVDTQQTMQRQLADGVKSLKTENAFAGALTLAALSFVYGVIHAVGPGHGKTIISSYVVANEETARRGVIISFIAAAMQAMTAVVLVGVLVLALHATGLEINAWSNQLESVSYALIALVGLWLLSRQLVGLWSRWRGARATKLSATHAGHGHHHHGQGAHDHAHERNDHDHDHAHHHHADGEVCDHVVDARALAGPMTWHKIGAVVFSVGIRPCTGAILVLVFAVTQGMFWAGVAATFAMALGTAITVAALAMLALGSRSSSAAQAVLGPMGCGPPAPSAARPLSSCLERSYSRHRSGQRGPSESGIGWTLADPNASRRGAALVGAAVHNDVEVAMSAVRLVESEHSLAADRGEMVSLGPTTRRWAGSARAGRLNPPRTTIVPTAAHLAILLRANMVNLP